MDRGGKALEEEGEIPDSRGSGWRKECPGLLISTALCFSRSVRGEDQEEFISRCRKILWMMTILVMEQPRTERRTMGGRCSC